LYNNIVGWLHLVNKMLVGTENSVSLPLWSDPVDGQKWQTGLFSVCQGRKITPSFLVSAIFSEGFTETLGNGVYFQWMVHWNVGYEILFSVNSCTENSDKYSIFSEVFTEMLGSRFYFQWKFHWNNTYGNLISVNSLWTTLNWIPYFNGVLHLYLQWMNEWKFGLVIMAVVTSTTGKLHYADLG